MKTSKISSNDEANKYLQEALAQMSQYTSDELIIALEKAKLLMKIEEESLAAKSLNIASISNSNPNYPIIPTSQGTISADASLVVSAKLVSDAKVMKHANSKNILRTSTISSCILTSVLHDAKESLGNDFSLKTSSHQAHNANNGNRNFSCFREGKKYGIKLEMHLNMNQLLYDLFDEDIDRNLDLGRTLSVLLRCLMKEDSFCLCRSQDEKAHASSSILSMPLEKNIKILSSSCPTEYTFHQMQQPLPTSYQYISTDASSWSIMIPLGSSRNDDCDIIISRTASMTIPSSLSTEIGEYKVLYTPTGWLREFFCIKSDKSLVVVGKIERCSSGSLLNEQNPSIIVDPSNACFIIDHLPSVSSLHVVIPTDLCTLVQYMALTMHVIVPNAAGVRMKCLVEAGSMATSGSLSSFVRDVHVVDNFEFGSFFVEFMVESSSLIQKITSLIPDDSNLQILSSLFSHLESEMLFTKFRIEVRMSHHQQLQIHRNSVLASNNAIVVRFRTSLLGICAPRLADTHPYKVNTIVCSNCNNCLLTGPFRVKRQTSGVFDSIMNHFICCESSDMDLDTISIMPTKSTSDDGNSLIIDDCSVSVHSNTINMSVKNRDIVCSACSCIISHVDSITDDDQMISLPLNRVWLFLEGGEVFRLSTWEYLLNKLMQSFVKYPDSMVQINCSSPLPTNISNPFFLRMLSPIMEKGTTNSSVFLCYDSLVYRCSVLRVEMLSMSLDWSASICLEEEEFELLWSNIMISSSFCLGCVYTGEIGQVDCIKRVGWLKREDFKLE